jgi:hypothetical protein
MELHRKLSDKEKAKLAGKVSNRVLLLIGRQYLYGWLKKPLEEVTDDEFLSRENIGPRTLQEVRSVIPAPVR